MRCAKCGGNDMHVRWHTGGRYGNCGCGYYAKAVAHGEHLHYTCRTCAYEWTEPTLDTRAAQAQPSTAPGRAGEQQ